VSTVGGLYSVNRRTEVNTQNRKKDFVRILPLYRIHVLDGAKQARPGRGFRFRGESGGGVISR
jgi:hypothetical protein